MMEMKEWSRLDTVDLILEIENELKLDELTIDNVKVWPWLRIKLFFFLINSLERGGIVPINEEKKILSFYTKLKSIKLIASHLFKYSNQKSKDYVFIGSKLHRTQQNGSWMNKFVDPLIYKAGINEHSVIFDIDISFNKIYNSKNVYFLPVLKQIEKYLLGKNKTPDNKDELKQVIDSIDKVIKTKAIGGPIDVQQEFTKRILKSWSRITSEAFLWEKIFNKVKPKAVFTLCYYSESVLAANIAASRCNIPKVELQHGPINNLHLSYGSFSNIPNSHNSEFLPDIFLTWDQNSKECLENSFNNKQIINLGHPWLDYNQELLSSQDKISDSKRDIITYALQPSKEMGNQFPDYLLRWINESKGEYAWWFRLHPRQFEEYDKIKKLLEEQLDGVEWELEIPTYAPLPKVLSQSKYLITFCSGVISEAAFMGVPSIALSDLATKYYKAEHELKMLYIISDDDKAQTWQAIKVKLHHKIKLKVLKRNNSFDLFKELISRF